MKLPVGGLISAIDRIFRHTPTGDKSMHTIVQPPIPLIGYYNPRVPNDDNPGLQTVCGALHLPGEHDAIRPIIRRSQAGPDSGAPCAI
jgi:hypothetical protein